MGHVTFHTFALPIVVFRVDLFHPRGTGRAELVAAEATVVANSYQDDVRILDMFRADPMAGFAPNGFVRAARELGLDFLVAFKAGFAPCEHWRMGSVLR